jgi:cysteine desulfurase
MLHESSANRPENDRVSSVNRRRSAAVQSYMDYNATAPVRPEVVLAVTDALGRTGNPSSVHQAGRAARALLERAREAVAALVGAPPEAVVFTSGGTEANNQALQSVSGVKLASAVEHDSVLAALPEAPRLPVDRHGVIDLQSLEAQLETLRPALVSVMLANNETGVIQPIRDVVACAHGKSALVHCDAVQAAGKISIDISALGVDFMTLSAHKLGGPQGVGALVVGPGIEPATLHRGGAQERRWRPGTENLPGIAGFGRACEVAMADVDWPHRVGALRDQLEEAIAEIAPEAHVAGAGVARLANTSCLTMPGVANQIQLIDLDLAGIAVSAGSACSSGKVGPSHVLAAMGLGIEEAQTAIRVSLGWASTGLDVERFVAAWARLFERTRGRAAA